MVIEVREALFADAEGILQVLNPIIETGLYSAMKTPLTLAEQRAFLAGFTKRGVFIVAADGETLVGLQSIEPAPGRSADPEIGEISTFVRLGSHRRGIGRALHAQTLLGAKARGYRTLIATIRADNPRALAYYRSLGFVKTARWDEGDSSVVRTEIQVSTETT